MRFGDTEVGEQLSGGLGLHRSTAVGMQGQLAGWHLVLEDGIVEQGLEQGSAFRIGNAPADDPAAEDVEDDVEIEVAPFGWAHQLGDVPGPDRVGGFGQQFGFAIDRMPHLVAAFADLLVVVEDPVHGSDRAVVDAFVEQGGVDFGRREIGEARRAQQIEHGLALCRVQRSGRTGTARRRGRRPGLEQAPAMEAGARQSQGGAGGPLGNQRRRLGDKAVHQDELSLSIGGSGMLNRSETFF